MHHFRTPPVHGVCRAHAVHTYTWARLLVRRFTQLMDGANRAPFDHWTTSLFPLCRESRSNQTALDLPVSRYLLRGRSNRGWAACCGCPAIRPKWCAGSNGGGWEVLMRSMTATRVPIEFPSRLIWLLDNTCFSPLILYHVWTLLVLLFSPSRRSCDRHSLVSLAIGIATVRSSLALDEEWTRARSASRDHRP